MAFTRFSAPLSGFDAPDLGRRKLMLVIALIAGAGLIILLPPAISMGVVIAGFVAAGGWAAWTKIASQQAIRSPAEITRRIGLPALGVAQRLSAHALREVSPDQRTPHGYVLERPESQFAAVFRHALSFANKTAAGNRRAIIAVTSPYREEGATTVSLCLARTMAAQGKQVALIDCDLRKRTLTRQLGLSPRHGVWEAIGAPDVQRFFQLDPDSHVKVLPAGNEGGVFRDLFSKRGFFELIRALRRTHDCVILDCPAALSSVDARMIVGGADSVVLVVQHGKTPTSAIKSAQRQLNIGGNARPAGILINKAPKSRDLTEIGAFTRGEW